MILNNPVTTDLPNRLISVLAEERLAAANSVAYAYNGAQFKDMWECPGPQSELANLNSEVKEKFRHLRLRIQDLEQTAKEQDKKSEKLSVLREAQGHRRQMLSNQTAWRKANLACELSINNQAKEELIELPQKLTKESLVQTSSDITESLMSISRVMSQQVQQTTSSRTVLQTGEEFKAMSSTVQLGRQLITSTPSASELTDKLLILWPLALFLATVLYILKKRLFPFL